MQTPSPSGHDAIPVAPLILAFGDSLTAGYGLAASQSFAAQLQAALRVRWPGLVVHNGGVSGDTTASGRARLARMLSAMKVRPALAIVELGANDLIRGIDPARTRENLDAILMELARCGVPAMLAGMRAPPILGTFAARFDGIYPALAAAHGVPLYPFFLEGVLHDRSLRLADGVHPTAAAIAIIVKNILSSVVAALEEALALEA